jgi:hypothetical protein
MSRHLHAQSAQFAAPLVRVMPTMGKPPRRSRGSTGRCGDDLPGGVSAA